MLEPTAVVDRDRPQAQRAMDLFQARGLTAEHLVAIRAVGISDAGKRKRIQKGSGRNAACIQQLADEVKAALGGYFREFTVEELGRNAIRVDLIVPDERKKVY